MFVDCTKKYELTIKVCLSVAILIFVGLLQMTLHEDLDVYERFSARTTLAVSGGSTDLADFLVFDSPQTSKINALIGRPIR